MAPARNNRVVHLELQTGNLPRACGFYTRMFGWPAEAVDVGQSSYLTLGLGAAIEGGVVEHDSDEALWLPYVEVDDVNEAVRHAQALGAEIELAPREGPAGWRSVIAPPAGSRIAFWQPKA